MNQNPDEVCIVAHGDVSLQIVFTMFCVLEAARHQPEQQYKYNEALCVCVKTCGFFILFCYEKSKSWNVHEPLWAETAEFFTAAFLF